MNSNNYCVIMAGGIGSRFWPLSRQKSPKQFLDILGTGKTMIQMAFARFNSICPTENYFIVTNEQYKDIVLEQLPQLKPEQVLLEPIMRNTAPCVAYANYKIKQKNKNAHIIVSPADHLITNEIEFINVVNKGLEYIKSTDKLLTLGLKPNRPETGYGYIQVENNEVGTGISKAKTFTEKPDRELAKIFMESGDFFWNSGIFIWTLSAIDKAFKTLLPDINALFTQEENTLNKITEKDFINKIYPECQNISIDYGILEKSDNVYVFCADFGWSDLGNWGSLYDRLDKDEAGNTIQGNNVMLYDSEDCLINVPKEKLVVVQGMKNYIIVDNKDTLLICNKGNEQDIKTFIGDIKISKKNKFI
ncbi:mannose-1-phosphate guanylyltransferase [Ancylomarina sp. 16SWW S1-10-2]|uniref:mannose-1-phosphate guanylyltransferase n=1 Tax=Ancylomarina sp. 16SWW S1-10-2 TaxID=2499681 RepID=UPI0012AE64AE|nr:mannose-1-phosphate guanylyltransferase [Ancylomarina sp. 16SWW S1-10-2]MRT92441.1 mannose-1-phosphate guanylyltransferase [Ancylomarina sp. 16SWW S1-10-2]